LRGATRPCCWPRARLTGRVAPRIRVSPACFRALASSQLIGLINGVMTGVTAGAMGFIGAIELIAGLRLAAFFLAGFFFAALRAGFFFAAFLAFFLEDFFFEAFFLEDFFFEDFFFATRFLEDFFFAVFFLAFLVDFFFEAFFFAAMV
jgi:hypothetical protein